MSFPSCIKIPVSRNSIGPELKNHNGFTNEAVSYNELISIANKVFGHGRWSHSVTNQTVDFVEYVMGKYHIGCAAFVKIQLADGTFHEDMGYSNTESSVKGSAIYSARSSSITLALKKALLCFGGVIEEKINEVTPKTKIRHGSSKAKEERLGEAAVKDQKSTEIVGREARCSEAVSTFRDNCDTKKSVKEPPSVSTPKRNKSPLPQESEDALIAIATDADLILADECQDPMKISADQNIAIHKDGTSTAMTEDDIRLERKRKQKQKQEEYKKLMKEKQMKSDDKPNPRF